MLNYNVIGLYIIEHKLKFSYFVSSTVSRVVLTMNGLAYLLLKILKQMIRYRI